MTARSQQRLIPKVEEERDGPLTPYAGTVEFMEGAWPSSLPLLSGILRLSCPRWGFQNGDGLLGPCTRYGDKVACWGGDPSLDWLSSPPTATVALEAPMAEARA